MTAFDDLAEVPKDLKNRYVRQWKEEGKKVMGYTCTYMPEEIFYAADILPYRITGMGASDTSRADAYLSRVNCSYTRCGLELGMRGEYDFLDGVVFINGCDHLNRFYDNWAAQKNAPRLMHMLPVPHVLDPDGRQLYKEEVNQVKVAIEEKLGCSVSSEKLDEARTEYNKARKLLKQLYKLRVSDEQPFSAAGIHSILAARVTMPIEEFNRLLSKLLDEEQQKIPTTGKVRLLVAGSMLDDTEFLENIENMGAVIVADSLCFGARSFWDLTDEDGDPFEAIIDRYYNHTPCPRMAGQYERRLAFIMEQAQRTGIDGVILEHIKFCDLHATDNALLKTDLEKEGFPVLELERQYGPLADAGRVKTRIQAFVEKVQK